MLVAFQCTIDPVLERLRSMGYAGPLREITVQSPRGPVRMVLLEDPNGVRFELTEFLTRDGGDTCGRRSGIPFRS